MRILLAFALIVGNVAAAGFEVVSIKPAEPGARGMGMQTLPGGSVRMKNVTLRLLVTMAWDLREHQLSGGPSWLDTEHFDILAKPEAEIPETTEGKELRSRLIQAMIVERFGLGFHRETKDTPIYALTLAKSGPKLAASAPDVKGSLMMGRGTLEGKHQPAASLAKILASPLGRTVVDQTGLSGDYDFTLKWTPDPSIETQVVKGMPNGPPSAEAAQPTEWPSLFTAIQEQLGLKLEPRKGPVELFIIDRAEKPSEN